MIYIRLEMWPRGDRKQSRLMGEATIANVGGTETRGNYVARISKRGGFKGSKAHEDPELARVLCPKDSSVWKTTSLESFPRTILGAWDLLYRVLRACLSDRNTRG